MKHKILGIMGMLMLVLGVVLIILQLVASEKSLIGSIAAGASPITTGSILIGVSHMLERKKKSSIDRSDTP